MKLYKFESERDLHGKDFKEFLEKVLQERGFAMFIYAPWCGACRQMHPEFQKAISGLGSSSPAIVVKFSDETMSHLTTQHAEHPLGQLLSKTVDGFPTLCYVNPVDSTNSIKVKRFNESRDSKTIGNFIITNSGSSSKVKVTAKARSNPTAPKSKAAVAKSIPKKPKTSKK